MSLEPLFGHAAGLPAVMRVLTHFPPSQRCWKIPRKLADSRLSAPAGPEWRLRGRQNAVDEAILVLGHRLPLPVRRLVVDDGVLRVVFRRLGRRTDERRVDQHPLLLPVGVDPADAVGGRQRVDVLPGPRLGDVRTVRQDADAARAVGNRRRKPVRDADLWNPVAVDVVRREVDHVDDAGGHHVTGPGRILEPDQVAGARKPETERGRACRPC